MSANETEASRRTAIFGWITLAARLILGGILIYAGVLKVGDLRQSVIAVQAYEFPIPIWMEFVIGYSLPVVEILLGLVIVVGLFSRWSSALGGLLMVAYIAGIASAWARGLNIDCGCLTPGGGLEPGQATMYFEDILRDIGLVACAVWTVIFPASTISLDS
ncbi:MAG: DoxX family protein, partial [Propionibacteriaceae bacterium]|nr:DoxX family protein [Propionibacteriaceae bacterium]